MTTNLLKQNLNSEQKGNAQNSTHEFSNNYIKHIIFNAKNFGKVVSIKDGVAFVVNLKNVTFGELVLFIPSPLRLKKHREKNQQS
jgi:F0F1-type ATP synthase alpha subunit